MVLSSGVWCAEFSEAVHPLTYLSQNIKFNLFIILANSSLQLKLAKDALRICKPNQHGRDGERRPPAP